jgi:hypothetical protein
MMEYRSYLVTSGMYPEYCKLAIYVDFRYAECRYRECHYAEYRGAKNT